LDGRRIVLVLAKNAASLSESQWIAGRMRPDGVLLALNDEPADGRDVSWIWDVDLPDLQGASHVGITGKRHDDLALRLKYERRRDGAPWPVDVADPDPAAALPRLIERTPPGGVLVVLATYTALLAVRAILEQLGAVGAMPT
jgi:UDP-N-acetylmuramyl tripeptide synthase